MISGTEAKRILAIDGGGSKTIAWIANALPSRNGSNVELEVIGRGVAGPSNPRSVGFDIAFSNLTTAIAMARNQTTNTSSPCGEHTPFAVACLSLAGAGRIEEQSRVREWADGQRLANQTIVVDDVEPLRLAAMYEQDTKHAFEENAWEQSVTLVVGTGSIACGRNGESRSSRVGGWGYLLGDEGSGFAIGLAGLQSVCKSHDRGGQATAFQTALLKAVGLETSPGLVGFIYQNPLPRAQVAALSEIVIGYASSDPIAAKILEDSIEAMADLIATTACRLELEHLSYSLAMSGGIVCNHPEIVAELLHRLEQSRLAPVAHHLVREPIHGPLLMAARHVA
jgi:N-acetylglucosamine kinase-like BadF-type ATPase